MRYALDNTMAGTQQNLSSSYKTMLSLTAATGATTLRRSQIFEVAAGADTAPNATDCPITGKIDRQTTVGTASAATPAPLDSGDAAALMTANANATIEPTVTSNTILLPWSVNQRAAYLWQAAPGAELITPATNTAGLGLRCKSPNYASTMFAGVKFLE